MLRALVLLILAVSLGCGVETVSTPSKVEAPVELEAVAPTPEPAAVVERSTCTALRDGVLVVRNETSQAQTYFGFSTDKDQALIGAQVRATVQPGDEFIYQGAPKCSQVDVSHQEWPGYTNVQCAAWYGVDGRPKDDPRKVDWAACAPATQPQRPTATPSPNPTPQPSPSPTQKCPQ